MADGAKRLGRQVASLAAAAAAATTLDSNYFGAAISCVQIRGHSNASANSSPVTLGASGRHCGGQIARKLANDKRARDSFGPQLARCFQ